MWTILALSIGEKRCAAHKFGGKTGQKRIFSAVVGDGGQIDVALLKENG